MTAATPSLASIPERGPVVIIADGRGAPAFARAAELGQRLHPRRADLRVVDTQPSRRALRALRHGAAVAFVVDGQRAGRLPRRWCDKVIQLAQRCAAPIVAVRLDAAAGGRTRTHRSRGIEAGAAVPASELSGVGAPARSAYLQMLLRSLQPPAVETAPPRVLAALAAAVDPALLEAEIDALPRRRVLVQRGQLSVCLARAGDAPAVLREIARLRELSFRAVGEGSGRASDRDGFDDHYEHLFVWHAERREIAGAYRLAFTDEVLRTHGIAGLYSSTLFHYDQRLLDAIGPAIELGRSFVAPQWQRSFQPLRLLWAGIAALLAQRPSLRCLFGPVSISATYSTMARVLMAQTLTQHHGDTALSDLVQPRHPPLWPRGAEHHRHVASALADVQLLSRTIARVERGMGLPVLLRQYVELNGRFAGFTVDESFGGTLDGLVFVDVARIPPAMLAKLRAMSAVG